MTSLFVTESIIINFITLLYFSLCFNLFILISPCFLSFPLLSLFPCFHSSPLPLFLFFFFCPLSFLASLFPLRSSEGADEALPISFLPLHSLCPSGLLSRLHHLAPSLLSLLLRPPHHHLLAPHPCHFSPSSPSSHLIPLYSLLPAPGSWTNQNEPRIDPLHTVLMTFGLWTSILFCWYCRGWRVQRRRFCHHGYRNSNLQPSDLTEDSSSSSLCLGQASVFFSSGLTFSSWPEAIFHLILSKPEMDLLL